MSREYLAFITKMKRKLGIDLTLYKEAQMKRRLTSLRNKRGFPTFDAYYKALKVNEGLLDEFVDRITINVSEFYRNPKRWDILQTVVLPNLLKRKEKLSIWSAACSTGEEPYSIALMLKEHFPRAKATILATDIDEGALEKAKQGAFPEPSLKELPPNLKYKYFTEKAGHYHINKDVRQMVSFREHNLLSDRYPRNMDLIVCRNVLIYFTEQAKTSIYNHFSSALSDGGILFVGSTEQIFSPHQYDLSLFDTFFYQKTEAITSNSKNRVKG